MRQNKWSRDQRFQDLSDDRVFFDRAWTELTYPCAHSTLQVTIEAHCPTVERQDLEGAAPRDATAEVAEVDGKAKHHRDSGGARRPSAVAPIGLALLSLSTEAARIRRGLEVCVSWSGWARLLQRARR
jgi:hypothetical protein